MSDDSMALLLAQRFGSRRTHVGPSRARRTRERDVDKTQPADWRDAPESVPRADPTTTYLKTSYQVTKLCAIYLAIVNSVSSQRNQARYAGSQTERDSARAIYSLSDDR